MKTTVHSWKTHPRPYRDAELIRLVTSDANVTPLERELALRMDRMLYESMYSEEAFNPAQLKLL